jgi:hypothetical protein
VMGADGTLGIHAAEVIDTLARKLTKQWDINNPKQSAWSKRKLFLFIRIRIMVTKTII